MAILKNFTKADRLWFWTVVLLFGLTVGAFYPGFMGNDEIDQYAQAKNQYYTGWHPPVMSWLWNKLLWFSDGPAGMLVFQNLCFWSGVLLLGFLAGGLYSRLVLLFFSLMPPVISQLGSVTKDTGMSVTLFLACAVALTLRERRWALRSVTGAAAAVLCLLSLLYAVSVRWDAVTAIFPVCFLAAWAFAKSGRRLWPGTGLLLFAVLLLLRSLIFHALVAKDQRVDIRQALEIFDLAGISVREHKSLMPVYLQDRGVDMKMIQDAYSPETNSPLMYESKKMAMPLTKSPAYLHELDTAWIGAVRAHPVSYLGHRFRCFMSFLRLTENRSYLPYRCGIPGNDLGLTFNMKRFSIEMYLRYMQMSSDTLFFRPYVYLLLCLALFVLGMFQVSCGNHQAISAALIAMSGGMYLSFLFFYGLASDFRYAYWAVLASGLSLFLSLCEWSKLSKTNGGTRDAS
ncbi:MAG: hypothetical protein PHN49_02440 [Candidatus Omnitrophica bacterium]|nr:hypothetical protein [Candidatus Omnitrophota bacterium]MDD5670478.1 hypothetical protein [Candidatus Omnitrophota bacterium]